MPAMLNASCTRQAALRAYKRTGQVTGAHLARVATDDHRHDQDSRSHRGRHARSVVEQDDVPSAEGEASGSEDFHSSGREHLLGLPDSGND